MMPLAFHETPFLTPEARFAASRLPNKERQWMIENILHRYEFFDVGWKLLKDAHMPVNDGDIGKGNFGALYGETRAGKSAICKAYFANHPRSVGPDAEIYPIVYIEATAAMTPSTLTDAMYFKTGSRAQAAKVPLDIRNMNAIDRLIRHGVQLVILDDVQYLLFNRPKNEIRRFGSFIRSLIEAKGFAVVIVGEPQVQEWVLDLPEMSGRDYFEEFMGHYDRSDDGKEKFQLFMGAIDDLLPFAEWSDLGEPEIADELYAYSDGFIGRVMVVLKKACWTSINVGHRRIQIETLRDTSRRSPWKRNQRLFFDWSK